MAGQDNDTDNSRDSQDNSDTEESSEDVEAQRLLGDLMDDDGDGGTDSSDGSEGSDDEQLREPGKRALERIKTQRNKLRDEADELRKQIKKYEDEGKTESQRLQEAAEDAKHRASDAEQRFQKMQAALDAAPDGASLAQIRAVAKRVSGDTEEELAEDAEELFTLIVPKSTSEDTDGKPGPVRRPRERLRGGGEPDDEPEEARPNKLADLIGRH